MPNETVQQGCDKDAAQLKIRGHVSAGFQTRSRRLLSAQTPVASSLGAC